MLSLTLPLAPHLLQLRVSLITLAALIVAFIIRLLGFLMAIMCIRDQGQPNATKMRGNNCNVLMFGVL